jgi:hypothetical protein
MGPSIVAAGNSSKTFLPSSVPLEKNGGRMKGFNFEMENTGMHDYN